MSRRLHLTSALPVLHHHIHLESFTTGWRLPSEDRLCPQVCVRRNQHSQRRPGAVPHQASPVLEYHIQPNVCDSACTSFHLPKDLCQVLKYALKLALFWRGEARISHVPVCLLLLRWGAACYGSPCLNGTGLDAQRCKIAANRQAVYGRGLFIFRGKEIPPIMLEECLDLDLYHWKKVDLSDPVRLLCPENG